MSPPPASLSYAGYDLPLRCLWPWRAYACPVPAAPTTFLLSLPDLPLERGGVVRRHRAAVWWWSRAGDSPRCPRRDIPTVLLVHALTGGPRAGGQDGWWEPLIGPGRALDPERRRIICCNNLGSFYGSSAPGTPGFPRRARLTVPDQARALLLALDALGLRRLDLVIGGSLGGMIAQTLAALAPARCARLLVLASSARATPWSTGWNHVARQILHLDASRGLEVARQLAMLTYRAPAGLVRGQEAGRIGGYLEHHGEKLHGRFTPACYAAQLDAMDAHDLTQPLPGSRRAALARIRARTLVAVVDSDVLFPPADGAALVRALRRHGRRAQRATIRSPHGHDAFLLEWRQLDRLVRRALRLPAS